MHYLLIALLPLPFPPPSSLQIGLVRRPESGGAHVRELLRHSTDDVCARGRFEARRSTRCKQDAEVDFDGFCQGDERHRDDTMRSDEQDLCII